RGATAQLRVIELHIELTDTDALVLISKIATGRELAECLGVPGLRRRDAELGHELTQVQWLEFERARDTWRLDEAAALESADQMRSTQLRCHARHAQGSCTEIQLHPRRREFPRHRASFGSRGECALEIHRRQSVTALGRLECQSKLATDLDRLRTRARYEI